MSTRNEFKGVATSTRASDDGTRTIGRYHQTDIIEWNDEVVLLRAGGFQTVTTKRRLNAASRQFGLGFDVYQKQHVWYITLPNGDVVDFEDGMVIDRKTGTLRELVQST